MNPVYRKGIYKYSDEKKSELIINQLKKLSVADWSGVVFGAASTLLLI